MLKGYLASPGGLRAWCGALTVLAITALLVVLDIGVGSVHRYWSRHSFTSSVLSGLLVLLLTVLIVDRVTRFRKLRDQSRAIAAQAAIVLAQAERATDLIMRASTSDDDREAASGELRTYTLEAATGLGHLGKVRVLDPPHTQPNFVMREMGYQVARKHAQKLRKAALLFAFGLPILLLLISQAPGWAIAGAVLATLSLAAGLIIERWLFFAEAEHVSMLYYGEERL